MPTWADLERPKRPEPKADEFADLAYLTFASGPGQRMLAMFRQMTIEKVLKPGGDSGALLSLEAQRQFVRTIENAVARGRAIAEAKAKK